MAVSRQLLQPLDIFLLQRPADDEEVDASAALLYSAGRFDGVRLRLRVEVALLIVPVRCFPGWKIAAHLQVERDGNERFALALCPERGPCTSRSRTGGKKSAPMDG